MPSLQFWEDAPLIRRPIWVWVDALLESDDQGGGNKAQVIAEQLPDLMRQGYNAVVSAGSEASNHVQALANACSDSGLRCDLTLYPVPGGWYDPAPRWQQLAEAGAMVHRIEHVDVLAQTMLTRMDVLAQQGHKTYYWHSDGNPIYAIPAYLKACVRFLDAWGRFGGKTYARGLEGPDQVYLAAGTGLTLTGLRLGLPETTAIHGISSARDARRIETEVDIYLEQFMLDKKALEMNNLIMHQPFKRMLVDDTHRMGGYGRIDPDLMRLSQVLTERSGIEFDPIYTAKAYAGMCALLDSQEFKGSNGRQERETVVFWHTGPRRINPIPDQPTFENAPTHTLHRCG